MNMAVEVSDEVIEERIMLCMLLLMRIDGFFRCCCCVDRSKKFSHASVLMETHVMFDRSFSFETCHIVQAAQYTQRKKKKENVFCSQQVTLVNTVRTTKKNDWLSWWLCFL